ncbi:MAG: hypothetical protein IKJ58_02250 [Akkermansia sp.]|nr:hypothetical protein [Akkermansia sp.]
MTEKQLKEVKPGDRLLIHVEVLRHDPKGCGLDVATVHPEDGHIIGSAFFAYCEACSITPEACSVQEEPYGVCCYTGEHGTFWAVEHVYGGRVATFFTHALPDAQKKAVKLRDKLNYLFNKGKEQE